MSKDTGGQAFPGGQKIITGEPYGGMTLRDYFAGQALEKLTFNDNEWAPQNRIAELMANKAYKIADAMIKQRETSNA